MAREPTRGATIRIFLVEGRPQGLRLVDRMTWTGTLLAFARADYAAARDRPEVGRTGVYVLLGPEEEGPRSRRAYIGESEDVRQRLDGHQREKDFWTSCYVLTTKDNSLNKAHVLYLEAQLAALARRADIATLDNGTEPAGMSLNEADVAEMETYLDDVLPMFALAGADIFEPTERARASDLGKSQQADEGTSGHRLYLDTALTKAEGEEQSRGFLVLAGSVGRLETMVMAPGYERLRAQLLQEGVLIENGDHVELTKDYVFGSPSAAANVLSGGNKNGRTEWHDGQGRTLKELQEQTAS
jgi:hypothetical protein